VPSCELMFLLKTLINANLKTALLLHSLFQKPILKKMNMSRGMRHRFKIHVYFMLNDLMH